MKQLEEQLSLVRKYAYVYRTEHVNNLYLIVNN